MAILMTRTTNKHIRMNLWAAVLTVHVDEVHDVMNTIGIVSRGSYASVVWYSPT